MKKREDYLDIAKGCLILLLCSCHFLQALSVNEIHIESAGQCTSWHYLYAVFFMQAFFFITGYCTRFETKGKQFLIKNLKSLVIPAILFTVINRIILSVFYTDSYDSFINNLLYGVGFWFLWALFFSKMIVWGLIRTLRKHPLFIVGLLLISVLIGYISFLNDYPNILYHQQFLAMSIFVYAGNQLRQHPILYQRLIKYGWGGYFLLMAIITIFQLPYSIISGNLVIGSCKEIPIYISTATFGTLFILQLSKIILPAPLLQRGGLHSLIIYGFHFPILCLLILVWKTFFGSSNSLATTIIVYILVSFFTFILSLYLSICLSRASLYKYLTGKW